MSPQPHARPDVYYFPSIRATLYDALVINTPLCHLIPFESRIADIMDNPEALIQQAEKLTAKGKSGWSFFGGSEEKYEQAATCYRQAAQAYEIKGHSYGDFTAAVWRIVVVDFSIVLDAAATYIKAADIQANHLSDDFEAPDSYVHASDAYRRALMEEVKPLNDNEKAEAKAKAINCRKKAITLTEKSTSSSKLRRLSRMYDAIGQINENDIAGPLVQARIDLLNSKKLKPEDKKRMNALAAEQQPTPQEADELQWLQSKTAFNEQEKAHLKWLESEMLPPLQEARIAYKEAANFLRLDAPINANKLLTQYADLGAFLATLLPHPTEKGNAKYNYYQEAIDAYQSIIKFMQSDPKHRFNLSTYYFKLCICILAQCDFVGAPFTIETYQQMDTMYQQKYNLLFNLLQAIANKDPDGFDALVEGDQSLDKWQVTILDDVKNSIVVEDDEFA
ncbi:hypothetical protein Trihar35433_6484 [Trichoderma harzianum]|nr:hypothetical protein Trihar35433_6484 [Trichoderma harzianum]